MRRGDDTVRIHNLAAVGEGDAGKLAGISDESDILAGCADGFRMVKCFADLVEGAAVLEERFDRLCAAGHEDGVEQSRVNAFEVVVPGLRPCCRSCFRPQQR